MATGRINNQTVPTIDHPSGPAALGDAIEFLYVHLLIFFTVALLATLVAAAADGRKMVAGATPNDAPVPKGFARALKESFWDSLVYCGAFALFGVVTAYFLALGLQVTGEANSLLPSFVPAFLSLLTGGVAFVAAKSKQDVSRSELVLGIGSFLLAAVLSYQTLSTQVTGVEGPNPDIMGRGADTSKQGPPLPSDINGSSASNGNVGNQTDLPSELPRGN